ncbi:hypothetical protein CLDAP_38960 [Caldilinea aerophila DSM 14535 = NBRC 104270]|uniref:Uncharacterized protein n=1 Tax=Caldilinea aerophila (strain DSM 14535 / JCM 11387 / NBRC 104270 / STL-6-O1) TaxID=926550 RepID=I0I9J8_CALAS|nr:hypothetical protein CLDAP_38960 [Caldilinea aerophila DSM 14535 = NBRC 104270]
MKIFCRFIHLGIWNISIGTLVASCVQCYGYSMMVMTVRIPPLMVFGNVIPWES